MRFIRFMWFTGRGAFGGGGSLGSPGGWPMNLVNEPNEPMNPYL
jgi:hypothetical protein